MKNARKKPGSQKPLKTQTRVAPNQHKPDGGRAAARGRTRISTANAKGTGDKAASRSPLSAVVRPEQVGVSTATPPSPASPLDVTTTMPALPPADAAAARSEEPARTRQLAPSHGPRSNSGARDPRLPGVGTTLVKRDRQGSVMSECTVEDGGIRYRGALYKSLSSAASAAAKDLGVSTSVNGFIFWGIVRPTRPAKDAADHLRRLAERFEREAKAYLARVEPTDAWTEVRSEIEAHAARLAELLRPVA
jgi:hypothetical protein